MGMFGGTMRPLLSRELMQGQQQPMMSRELMAQQQDRMPSMGYDRNAAMMGQSGFAPMNAGFTEQKKPGFFGKGGAFVNILGAFGDAFSGNGPVYAQQKAQRNRLMQEQQMAEQRRQQEREDFLFQEGYKRQNPMPAQPTEFERLVRSSGLPEPQQIQLMQDYVRNRANPIQGVPFTDEQGNTGLQFIRPNATGNAGGVQEGATATNPRTNEKIIFRNGKWEPVGGGVGNGTSGF